VLAILAACAGAVLLALVVLPAISGQRAAGQTGGAVVPQSDASVPARGVVLIGSSPGEAPAETWGIGHTGSSTWGIVRYAENSGWSVENIYEAHEHEPLSGFAPLESPLTGDVTGNGAGALLGNVTESVGETEHKREVLLVRSAGKSFHEVPAPPTALLSSEEKLFAAGRRPLLAALDEGGGAAGALLAPVNTASGGTENGVLHWNGNEWTREEIEIPGATKTGFRVLAIAASSPGNAWLLGQLPAGGVELFRRQGASKPIWKSVVAKSGGVPGERLTVNEAPFAVPHEGQPPTAKTQILTVAGEQGVWIDGERTDLHTSVTMFFKPEGALSGKVTASWCNGSSGPTACNHTLPESLPSGQYRSFAWPVAGTPYGQRVITGEPEGVSLRLEGETFAQQLALGSEEPSLGAAFSSPTEGWLGEPALPVHLKQKADQSRLQPYPVPFRFALLAIAPQPEAPVGALSSQALAVGDNGEVARYAPGQGWQPESLLGPGGRRVTPRLRAVAWPTAARAYAVGELGQMWLWRGETRLWEPDPAAPRNFRGDLLGVAFDPGNPQRGYAVGQQGVLLRYGKSWTQEALPAEVAGASFTSLAFAGSEAIVAYRVPHPQTGSSPAFYSGGLLVNDGSGWHVDQAAASALAPGETVPWAVAGLPDGGAALSGETRSNSEPVVLERGGPGQAWLPTPVPYPGLAAPGSLALFRENGALRVVGSGAIPNTRLQDFFEPPPPAGFPENLVKPYPPTSGHVLRQAPTGWSDEEHERIEATPPLGNYLHYDFPYEPDPTAAVLVDPTGSLGWAVGGTIETDGGGLLDTSDIARYPADGVAPPGVGASPVAGAASGEGLFAIAGNAECAAPCSNRAGTRAGPDTWLSAALQQVNAIPGVSAFLHIGPRVTTGQTLTGKVVREVPYPAEFSRYAELMAGSTVPTYPVAATPESTGGECVFEHFFPGLAFNPCSAQSAYYAFNAGGARVIVLDESTSVEATQLGWLKGQLAEAAAAQGGTGEPAIVVGSADLNAQVAAHDSSAAEVAEALADGGASAYFYNAPERNVRGALRAGAKGGSVPTFGTGTLGYVLAQNSARPEFIGHSGFLLVQIKTGQAARNTEGRWPVTVRLIPNVGELAIEAQDGVLLRRSQSALFAGLARRRRAGCLSEGSAARCLTSPYIPIPANCVGSACANAIFPEYSFKSSRKDFGDFVEPNLASPDPRAVLLGPDGKPIPDAQSGLFCAFNAGTTVVTISAGGISSSLNVTVQAGSVRRPCGTVPLSELPAQPSPGANPPSPAPAPTPAGPAPAGSPPLTALAPPPAPAVPPAAAPSPPPPKPPQPTTNFFVPPALAAALPAFVPPPVPTPARPTPPTGTSAVTSPVEVAEKEEEQEEAPESVSNQAVAYHPHEDEPAPLYILGVVVLAAFAGASVRRRPRRGRRDVQVAPATVSTMRAQRRVERAARRDVNRW
jgi:hypothetical protein